MLLTSFQSKYFSVVYLSFFSLFFNKDDAPVSCRNLSQHKDDKNLFGICIQSAENMSYSVL